MAMPSLIIHPQGIQQIETMPRVGRPMKYWIVSRVHSEWHDRPPMASYALRIAYIDFSAIARVVALYIPMAAHSAAMADSRKKQAIQRYCVTDFERDAKHKLMSTEWGYKEPHLLASILVVIPTYYR